MKKGSYIGLGIALGTVLGVITGNLALWLSLGVAIGAGLESTNQKRSCKTDETDEPDKQE